MLLASGYLIWSGQVVVPEAYNPWAPLDVNARPNVLTSFKLSRAKQNPDQCRAALSQSGMRYELLPDRTVSPGCGFTHAVRLRDARVNLKEAISLSCPMALSLTMWERHTLQPAAQQHLGQSVRAIDHVGSYACRNIKRGEGQARNASGGRSRHAMANALDITGLELDNGERVSVLRHWSSSGNMKGSASPESALLSELHQGACRFFDGALGPDYNALHKDHFHLETGGYSMCR
jgi:hypothetical protein